MAESPGSVGKVPMYNLQQIFFLEALCTAVEGAAWKPSSSLEGAIRISLLVTDKDMFIVQMEEILQEAAPTPRSKVP